MDLAIGSRIREQRKMAGLSQQRLSQKIGIAFQQLQKYENGTSRVPAGRLHQISRVLQTPMTRFFDEPPVKARSGSSYDSVVRLIDSGGLTDAKEILELARTYLSIRSRDKRRLVLAMAQLISKTATDK